ncbi:HNH endonuclease [Nostoc sp. FACHB-280]|uniref:HNH endonuclease n=1 Tax=Nostoc sp. FACHB-280 TaxID=2692839 RepID=UPI00168B626A|nr:HNH endonuclease [Nostoc sp. FACHB-280]MBD2494583.1 HNH endonuclease [Nostoc sp. FACHB-280]
MSVYIRVELQRQIRECFGECCAYCRTAEFLTAMTFEFEHIRPLSVGGETVFKNLCFACPSCNRYKADRQSAIDPQSGETVALFHPQEQVWQEHFAWDESRTQMNGLTAIGRATIEALQMNRKALVRARAMWVKLGEHPPELD